MANDIAIITAITGGYDEPIEQPLIDGVDYIFFTDGIVKPDVASVWQVEDIAVRTDYDSRRKAKFPKLNPQRYQRLRNYKYTIWMDGTMGILRPEMPDELLAHIKNGIVLSPHFSGHDAYLEATITDHPKYWNEPLAEQAEFYRSEGFPEKMPLYECGIMAMDPNHPGAEELSVMWLEQNLTWSYQDQVSLPYCIWKLGFEPGTLPQSWRDYEWVWMNIHKNDEENGS